MSKKEDKEKVVYYDDESTIADMSGVPGGKKKGRQNAPKSTFREKAKTYFEAVKMMFLPMCFVLGILAVLYIFLLIIAR